jgi:hypothetical protein
MADKIVDFQVNHPALTGAVLAAMMAYTGWTVYRLGLVHGRIHAFHAEAAHAASEALGG